LTAIVDGYGLAIPSLGSLDSPWGIATRFGFVYVDAAALPGIATSAAAAIDASQTRLMSLPFLPISC
jgi:hypothetical protein